MTIQPRSQRSHILAIFAAATLLLAGGCTGGGDTVVSGIGNSGNLIGSAALWETVAKELADLETTPRVSDEQLGRLYAAIERRALAGELEPALVLLRLAERQREE